MPSLNTYENRLRDLWREWPQDTRRLYLEWAAAAVELHYGAPAYDDLDAACAADEPPERVLVAVHAAACGKPAAKSAPEAAGEDRQDAAGKAQTE